MLILVVSILITVLGFLSMWRKRDHVNVIGVGTSLFVVGLLSTVVILFSWIICEMNSSSYHTHLKSRYTSIMEFRDIYPQSDYCVYNEDSYQTNSSFSVMITSYNKEVNIGRSLQDNIWIGMFYTGDFYQHKLVDKSEFRCDRE